MNEEIFTGKAKAYDKYRPSYPTELIEWLYEKTRAKTVADIGAGTGKFTECLTKKPWRVTAVEPNADMLQRLRANFPDIEIINAPAEGTGLKANSVDLVTAATAFHWFDREKFKSECRRILTENGHLAIIGNNRVDNEFMTGRNKISLKYCGKCHGEGSSYSDTFLRNEYFAHMEYYSAEFDVPMDEERFLGDMISHSYSLKKGDDNFEQYIDELRELFYKYQQNGTVKVKYQTDCYLGKF